MKNLLFDPTFVCPFPEPKINLTKLRTRCGVSWSTLITKVCTPSWQPTLGDPKLSVMIRSTFAPLMISCDWLFEPISPPHLQTFPEKLMHPTGAEKLHPSLKIDFFEKSQFCSCWAPIRLIW